MKNQYKYCSIFLLVLGLHLTVFALNFSSREVTPPVEISEEASELNISFIQIEDVSSKPSVKVSSSINESKYEEALEATRTATALLAEKKLFHHSLVQQYTNKIDRISKQVGAIIQEIKIHHREINRLKEQSQLDEKKQILIQQRKQLAEKKRIQAYHKMLAKQREIQKQNLAIKRKFDKKRRQKQRAAKARQRNLARKITQKARAVKKSLPSYPSLLRRKGIEGTVKLILMINYKGKVTAVKIRQSSGHSLFDKAALRAAKRWRYLPAKNGLNDQVNCSKYESIVFRLN